MSRRVCLVVMLLVASCAERRTLVVQLVTDLAPLAEFDGIEVEAPSGTTREPVSVRRGAAYGRPVRLLERTGVAPGSAMVRVSLRLRGTLVRGEERRVSVRDGTTYVTVRIDRSCLGVTCDDPGASACLAGRCVPPDCTPENPAACPPSSCFDATDCPMPPAACASAVCAPEGVCEVVPDDERCGPAAVCGSVGCLDVPTADAGPLDDAGPNDAGVDAWSTSADGDAGLDAAVGADTGADAGPSDAGPSFAPIELWGVAYLATSTTSLSVAAIPGGGAAIALECDRPLDLGGGPLAGLGGMDVCVASYADGQPVASFALGSSQPEAGARIDADATGLFVLFEASAPVTAGTTATPAAPADLVLVWLTGEPLAPAWAVSMGLPTRAEVVGDLCVDGGSVHVYAGAPNASRFDPYMTTVTVSDATAAPGATLGASLATVNRMSCGDGSLALGANVASGNFGGSVIGSSGALYLQRLSTAPFAGVTAHRLLDSTYGVITDVAWLRGVGPGPVGATVYAETLVTFDPSPVAVQTPAGLYGLALSRSTGGLVWTVDTGAHVAPLPVPVTTSEGRNASARHALFAGSTTDPSAPFGGTGIASRGGFVAALDIEARAGDWVRTFDVPSMLPLDVDFDPSTGVLYVAGFASAPFDFAGTRLAPGMPNESFVFVLAYQTPW